MFFEHKTCYQMKGEIPDGEYTIPIGKAAVRREGTDVTVVTYSLMTYKAEEAANELAKEGISVEIIDLRTILPLDYDTVMASIEKTNRVVVVHESLTRGGLGGDIIAEICKRGFDLLDAPPLRVGAPSLPVPYNKGLEALIQPKPQDIIDTIRKVLE
jgi:pyruvate dehydrogenase E1 component beta subunit